MTHLTMHPRTAPGPVARATAIKWSRSLLDSRFHAIDEMADHIKGAYRAECGHMLLAVTVLLDAPIGAGCEVCHARTRPLDDLWRALPGGRSALTARPGSGRQVLRSGGRVTVTTSTMPLATASPRGGVSDE